MIKLDDTRKLFESFYKLKNTFIQKAFMEPVISH